MGDNAKIFLKYIEGYGFDINKYNSILELSQSADESLSRYLPKDRQFLLSRNVRNEMLEKYNVNGAFGFLGESELVIPRTTENDERLLYKKKFHLSSFDVIVSGGSSLDLNNTIRKDIDKYIGFCLSKDSELLKEYLKDYKWLLNNFYRYTRENYDLEHDTYKDKELYLIRKK